MRVRINQLRWAASSKVLETAARKCGPHWLVRRVLDWFQPNISGLNKHENRSATPGPRSIDPAPGKKQPPARPSGAMDVSEDELQSLYTWVGLWNLLRRHRSSPQRRGAATPRPLPLPLLPLRGARRHAQQSAAPRTNSPWPFGSAGRRDPAVAAKAQHRARLQRRRCVQRPPPPPRRRHRQRPCHAAGAHPDGARKARRSQLHVCAPRGDLLGK
jgi:hypothetical protein